MHYRKSTIRNEYYKKRVQHKYYKIVSAERLDTLVLLKEKILINIRV